MTSPRAQDRCVREARAHDLDRLVALWTAITAHHQPLDPLFTMRRGAEGELGELLRSIMRDPDAAVFVYDDEGDLPGMCMVRVDSAPPILEEVERAEITDLGVREGRRREGIGELLARRALGWVEARGVRRVEVQVASRNREGQAFWRRQGFGDLMDVLQKRL